MRKLNRKKNIQRSDKRNVVDTSSSSDLSSDSSVEHIFQKKITSQKPSTLATPSQSRGNELRKKNTRIDLSNNHDDSSNRNHTNQNEKKNTQLSVTKNKHETMNEIIHNNNNNKSNIEIISNKRVNLLSRGDSSNSSSGKEFSQYKIIPSYIPLRRISDIESNVITSSVQSQSSTQTNNSKQNEFALKNNVDKFLQDMKSCVKKLENNIDHIAKNYRSKKELKVNDAMTMMVECTNMIRDLKEHVNNSEDKVINHYNKWCKKAKIKNIFLNKNSVKRDIITSSHKKCREIKPLVINSSSSDSETTLLNYPISEVNSPEKSPLANQNTKVNIVDVNENMDDQKSTEISDFDERQIFSSNETSNPPSPFTPNIILNNKKTINKTVKNRQLKSVSRRNSQRSNTYEKSSSTDTEIDDKLTKDSLLNAISDKINDKSVGSELKILESTSSPQSKTDMSKNHGGSTESIADMFEDEDDNDKNDKNSSHNKSRRKSVSEKNSQSKEEFINTEEIKSKNLLLCNDSSTDSEYDTTRISNKKSKIINLNDEEVQEKKEKESSIDTNPISSQLGTTQVSEQKNKSHTIENEKSVENYRENKKNLTNRKKFRSQSITIDGCDKSLSYDCISINNDTVDSREEHAKKILLDSSSDSDHEISNNISYERNDSLLNDIELNDSDELIKNNTKKIESMQEQLTLEKKLNNPLLKTKRKNFLLINNIHYKNDPKLRMIVSIKLPRLSKNILEQHPNALKLAKEYLENKQIKSLTSIDRIEKRKKKSRSSSSDNDEDSLKRSKKSREKGNELNETEETLMDHLDRAIENIEENNSDEKNDGDTDDSENGLLKKSNLTCLNDSLDNLLSDADNLYKATLLESSHSEGEDNEINNILIDNDPENSNSDNINEKSDNKNKIKNNKQNKCSDTNSDENSIKKNSGDDKAKWKRSKVLTMKFSDTDSEEENRKIEKKVALKMESLKNSDESDESDENDNKDEKNDQLEDSLPIKKKRTRRRRLASDSDVKLTDDSLDSDSDVDEQEKNNKGDKSSDNKKDGGKKIRKRQKNSDNSSDTNSSLEVRKPKAKRKRIRPVSNDSDSDSGNELNSSQGGNKSGRKNIRKVLKDKQVADDTKQAGKLEEERLRRMAERQKLYNEMYEARLATEEKVDKLVLDFDEESKEVLLSVHEKLVKRLKPHQARGIKFMWDAAFESLERAKTTSGSGCILAHCMGLGKSFQVVTLAHTLLSNSEKTGVNTILIVTPLSTVLNWVNEFKIWLSEVENGDDIEIYEMTKCKTTHERKYQLESWQRTGGILMIGYEMFRNLTNATKKVRKNVRESILKCLVDPGADLVICDEGHLLKNEDSAISKAMKRIRTLRRIVLTGTPLQNNLIEYHCMVQFVKPNLLGTKKEFSNRFVNPIQNGQFDDSTEYDVKVMKKRAHVLHKMLEGSVQRYDYSVLTPFLPPKQEYVILVRLTEVQVKLYQYYLDNLARKQVRVGSTLFADFQSLQRIWTHPSTVKSHTEKMIEKRREAETDSEGSLKDFIDDGSDTDSSSKSSSDNDSDVINLDSSENEKKSNRRGTRANPVNEEITEIEPENKGEWWSEFVQPEDLDDMRVSAKLLLLFDIIKECEAIGDKVLVFSQSLYSLTLIEKFLGMIDDETQRGNELESLNNHTGSWSLGLDYFRFDGQTSTDNRSHWVKLFNKPSNTRARLFLISTRAGGLGINLTASNRVVIFDASWNPSHDVQSIFRIYRFGQKKPCYIYRLLAAGTMEEKIYNRQVTKLSLSCRVVDEQQIERHFSNNDLAELYTFEPPSAEPPQLALPKDRLIAEIFLKHKNLIETYHEHDSLLENIAAEELDDEERKQAWLEYEQEKAGKRPMPMQMYQNYQQQQQMMMMMQQFNNPMMNLNEINVQGEFTNLLEFIRKDYPHLTEAAQKDMAFRALANMYTYVENQVTTNLNNPANILNVNNPMINNPMVNNQMVNNPIVNNPIVNPIANNPTATLANALAQQEYTRQHSSKYKQQQQQQMQYAQKFGNNVGNIPPAVRPIVATSRGDDIIEIPPSSSRTNVTLPPSNSTKSQEE